MCPGSVTRCLAEVVNSHLRDQVLQVSSCRSAAGSMSVFCTTVPGLHGNRSSSKIMDRTLLKTQDAFHGNDCGSAGSLCGAAEAVQHLERFCRERDGDFGRLSA